MLYMNLLLKSLHHADIDYLLISVIKAKPPAAERRISEPTVLRQMNA